MKKTDSPATTSLAYDAMEPEWTKVQTVLDGTEAMRAAGTKYLPQHKYEKDEAYRERLARAVLFNMTKMTLNSWVGRPFGDPINFKDVPEQIQVLFQDVDLLGTNIHVFARDWFSDGIAKAFSHVFVDFPRVTTQEQPRTLLTDRQERLRPYWIHYRPEQVIFAASTVINGQEVLTEIRVLEERVEQVGFAEQVVQQIRRIMPGVVEIYQQRKVKGKVIWDKVSEYTYDLTFIPLVTFYSSRDGFMMGKSPLADLVDLNIAHWQSDSDQKACLTVARFPILALSGGSDDDSVLKIGPNRWLYSPDPQSKFYYVEHSGNAIAAGRNDLQDLQARMVEYGAEFLRKRPKGETATARALDSAEATSPLQDITIRFGFSLTQALLYTAKWMQLEDGGTATLTTDFGPEETSQAELMALQTARKDRDISRHTFLLELKRRGLLADDFDEKADATLLEQETLDMFGTVVAPKAKGEEETPPKKEGEETPPKKEAPEEE